jgi:large subunit ribosomal protein L3
VREFRVAADKVVPVGTEIKCDIFNEGEAVDVVGTSKGKGFAGVIKRWNFRRGPMGHGSMYHRRTGSLGATDPARVFKGRKMPGRLGNARITVQNLKVVMVDPERNLILVRGAVPGINGSLVLIKESVKSKK